MKKKLDIIYEDKNILVINKPEGILSISTEKEKINTLFHKVFEYEKKKNKNNKVFIVHRLDKDTSGLIVFAKSEKVKKYLQENWNNSIRKYYAIVIGRASNNDTFKNNLNETKTNLTYVSKYGKKAITEYNLVSFNNKYSLVDINIKTGRKNQIRVQFAYNKLPILGDKKYGNNKSLRMYLHAYYLNFNLFNKDYEFKTDIPNSFYKIIK